MGGQDPRLGVAITRHRAGAVDEAVALYQAILTDNPAEADALHLLGVARQQQGDYATSVALISQALALRQDAAFASNLANAYLALGRHNEAADACRLALSLNAVFGMAYANLGVALNALGQRDEAVADDLGQDDIGPVHRRSPYSAAEGIRTRLPCASAVACQPGCTTVVVVHSSMIAGPRTD